MEESDILDPYDGHVKSIFLPDEQQPLSRTGGVQKLENSHRKKNILEHSALIAAMTTKQGGLGIQHPRSTVISMYFLTMERNIQYATEGIWTNNHTPTITLPGHLRSLYADWENNSLPSLTAFRKYYRDFQKICVSEQVPDRDSFFLLRSSTNKCKEQITSVASM